MKVKIGIQLHPQHCTYAQLAEAAKKADQMGFDSLWTWDHFFPLYGVPGAPMGADLPPVAGDPPRRGDHFEGWTLLTAFACLTERIEIGMLVTCNSYRNPQLLADIFRTCDHVSGGRIILGLGSGWYQKDYEEYGYEFGTAIGRLKALEASLPVIKSRLAQLSPPPLRNPVPIMIGGGGEKVTLRLVAEHATMWNSFVEPKEMKHKLSVLRDWCDKLGRNYDEIEKTVLLTAGHNLVELAEAYAEVGVTHMICGTGVPFDLSFAQGLLNWRDQKNS
jgi:probable F420-dependent oxidoreductase